MADLIHDSDLLKVICTDVHIVYVVLLYMVMQIQSLLSMVCNMVQNIGRLGFVLNRHTLKGISQLDCDSYT